VVGVIERRTEKSPEKEDVGSVTKLTSDLATDIDLDRLLDIAERGRDISAPTESPFKTRRKREVKIAVSRDKAFSFYYPENLEGI
jgi:cobyrinic acid a,c-diamide synthase